VLLGRRAAAGAGIEAGFVRGIGSGELLLATVELNVTVRCGFEGCAADCMLDFCGSSGVFSPLAAEEAIACG
jgi:hypothetical protein